MIVRGKWWIAVAMMFALGAGAGCDLSKLTGSDETNARDDDDDDDGDSDSDDDDDDDDDDDNKKRKKRKKRSKSSGKKKKNKKKRKSEPKSDGDDAADPDESSPPSSPSPSPAPKVGNTDLFKDATGIRGLLEAKVGGVVRIQDLLIYPTYARADIQDPNKPLNMDRYMIRNGAVQDPSPIKLMGKKATEALLKKNTFDISEVDFKVVPTMVEDAPKQLKYEDAKVSHMILKRGLPFHDKVQWRVYVKSDRSSGSVEYDLKGVVVKVWD